MKIRNLFPDVITEDMDYEFKAVLNPDHPVKWTRILVAYDITADGIMVLWEFTRETN